MVVTSQIIIHIFYLWQEGRAWILDRIGLSYPTQLRVVVTAWAAVGSSLESDIIIQNKSIQADSRNQPNQTSSRKQTQN